MGQSPYNLPSRPEGVGPIGMLDDAGMERLAEALRNDESEFWFDAVHPPETPDPTVAQFPDYDHDDELAAAPDEPTEAYRERTLEFVQGSLDARGEMRPDSLRPLSELPTGITRRTTTSWVHYHASDELDDREHDRPESLAGTADRGKYLFFTPDEASVLEAIVVEQFQARPFDYAKVPSEPEREAEAVLCLYDADDRYRADLRETYQNEPPDDTHSVASPFDPDAPIVKPRGFKTNRATREGEYSEKFR